MRNAGGFGERALEKAAIQIEVALRQQLPAPWRRLAPEELDRFYLNRGFARGWRVDIDFSDGKTRSIDLLISPCFPAGYPRTALVDGPGQLVWPHVEHDGVLCLLPILAEVDAERPGEVAIQLIAKSTRLIEELLEGTIVERDFKEEFLTYWAYAATGSCSVHSLLEPSGPSRIVAAWRGEDSTIVVGEDQPSLDLWLTRRFGRCRGNKTRMIEPAVMLWLPEPPLPSQYPATGAELLSFAEQADGEGAAKLIEVAGRLPKQVTVVIGAEGRGGPGLVAVTTTAHRRRPDRHGRVEQPLTKGFQPNHLPGKLAALRTFSMAEVEKFNVQRADPAWIHGRGKDSRTPVLLGKAATIIGCGAIGSLVVARLVRAGVGTINVIDYDRLSWSNLGRHELGASSIGKCKATELAERLQAEFPHLTIVGYDASAQMLIEGYKCLLEGSDLIVAATGSWNAEGALNRWHTTSGRAMPIVYGWTERLAGAGHAVTVARHGGCLRCGIGPTGVPHFGAIEWGEAGVTIEEPACGNHFTPYGAVELGFVADLVADSALQALLNNPSRSSHSIWLAPRTRVEAAGGRWSDALKRDHSEAMSGAQVVIRDWPATACPACGEEASAAA